MNRALVAIISIILTAIVVGGGVYLFFNNRYLKDKSNLQSQIDVANRKVTDLQGQIDTLNAAKTTSSTTSTSSSSSGSTTVSENAAVMSACQSEYPGSTCTVSKIDGNYATGSVGSDGGGAMWYAEKQNGTWVIVTASQDTPSCSLTSTFPKSIVPVCGNF